MLAPTEMISKLGFARKVSASSEKDEIVREIQPNSHSL